MTEQAWQQGIHLSPEERRATGKAARKAVPRSSHAEWSPGPDRPDPVALIEGQDTDRLQWLVPVRRGRMSVSAFTFYRGAARVMATDLATTPNSGLTVQACGDAHLKVILSTGELGALENVFKTSMVCMMAGADFIKTSTGKIQPAATMQVTLVMLQAIRDYFHDTGRMVGMKPAGGISSAKLAVHYLVMLRETLGNAWMTPEWFRFGASSLANDVLMQIVKQETGVYQSPDYFSKD